MQHGDLELVEQPAGLQVMAQPGSAQRRTTLPGGCSVCVSVPSTQSAWAVPLLCPRRKQSTG